MSESPSPSRAALGAEAETADPAPAEPAPESAGPAPEAEVASGIAIPVDASNGNGSDDTTVLSRVVSKILRRPAQLKVIPDVYPRTELPALEPGWSEVEVKTIRDPVTFARILFHEERHEYRYEVVEPPLTDDEKTASRFLRETFVRTLDVHLEDLDALGRREYLRRELTRLLRLYPIEISPDGQARVLYYLERDFLGFGPIDVLMHDSSIEDVSCDGPGIPVFLYHRKYEAMRTNITFSDHETLDGFVMELVQRSGRHISIADPLVDATLPDGSRLQCSLARTVTTRGSTFTIRRFREDPLTPIDLLNYGTMSPEMLAYLWVAVENGASAIVCGGTASGKTTTLNALSVFIPSQLKIVSIEDTRELNLPHENWIPGLTRGASETGEDDKSGSINMFDLLKAALRQRPEYLLVGEIRGREAYVLFQAMATGHTVYSTMHADSASSAVYRLESKPLEIPRIMLNALDLFVIQSQIRIGGKRIRKVREVVEIAGIDPRSGELLTNRAFSWDPSKKTFNQASQSHVLDHIAQEMAVKREELAKEIQHRASVLRWMQATGARDLVSVWRIVAQYAADKKKVLRLAGVNPDVLPAA